MIEETGSACIHCFVGFNAAGEWYCNKCGATMPHDGRIFGPAEGCDHSSMLCIQCIDVRKISDGYHTFDEIYLHRNTLFIALCRELQASREDAQAMPWRSKYHSDGSNFPGWFLLGIGKNAGRQITYHLPDALWDSTGFTRTLGCAPKWDGHTPADVIARLGRL